MAIIKVYNLSGEPAGEMEVDDKVFNAEPNEDLLHQVIVGYQLNRRGVFAHTKTRGEVRGGGKKPWKQKGTGRARHGSIRSPLWRGGGITFGPRDNRNFKTKINKKIKNRALCMILTDKVKSNELIAVEKLSVAEPKTKTIASVLKLLLEKVAGKKSGNVLIVADADRNLKLACRNLKDAALVAGKDLSVLEAVKSGNLIIDKNALQTLEKRLCRF